MREAAIKSMKAYYGDRQRSVDHTLQVLGTKYGSVSHRQQEEEGAPVARQILAGLQVRPDVSERVCYIVGHHHTAAAVDGPDFQVVWEADALVNIPAKTPAPEKQTLDPLINSVFSTPTGLRLIRQVMGL